jgi:hypothetical protein
MECLPNKPIARIILLAEYTHSPFYSVTSILRFLEIWFKKSGSRNLVQEIWFKKFGSRNLVQEIWFKKSGSRNLV